MNFTKKQIFSSIMVGLMSTSMTVAWGQQVPNYEDSALKPVLKNLPQATYIIDRQTADVNGDNIKDTIYLIGHKSSRDAIFADHLKILVQDGATKKERVADLQDTSGYKASLFIGDFTGDKVNDVLVTAPTGGSGGIVEHVIVKFDGDETAIIFNQEDNKGAKFAGKFVDGFKAELVNENTGRNITIDLNAQKDRYSSSKFYNEDGKLLQTVKPVSYPFGVLIPVDMDGDGVYELKGIQKIIGAYGADTIANVYSYWKFAEDHWTANQIEVSTFLLQATNLPKPSDNTDKSANIAVINESDNNKEIAVQSGDEIQIKIKESAGTGYKWSFDNLNNDYFELVSEKTEALQNKDKRIGAPSMKVITLRAKKAGTTEIKMNYFRPWESKESAVKTFAVKINIKK